jgi:YidC/Oxa1 family membrane protein insertase
MLEFFRTILIYPLLNLLVFTYNYIPDIGVVIIILTVLIRLLLLPSFHKSLKHQKALADLQPKMNEIRDKYKDDKERQARAMMELYSAHKVNPLSSCLPLLIQLPILIALYQVFIRSLNGHGLEGIYNFITTPSSIDPYFFGFINLAEKNIYMAVVAAILQFWQARISQPKTQSTDPTAKMLAMQTMYFFPVLTLIIGLQFPAGLALYWIVTTLFGIGQQYYILRKEAREALYGKSK